MYVERSLEADHPSRSRVVAEEEEAERRMRRRKRSYDAARGLTGVNWGGMYPKRGYRVEIRSSGAGLVLLLLATTRALSLSVSTTPAASVYNGQQTRKHQRNPPLRTNTPVLHQVQRR